MSCRAFPTVKVNTAPADQYLCGYAATWEHIVSSLGRVNRIKHLCSVLSIYSAYVSDDFVRNTGISCMSPSDFAQYNKTGLNTFDGIFS